MKNVLQNLEYLAPPLAFAFYAIAFLAAYNVHEILLQDATRGLVAAGLAALMIFAATRLVVRDGYRASLITFMVVALFFSYGHVRSWARSTEWAAPLLGRHRYLPIVFAGILAVWVGLVMRWIKTPRAWIRGVAMAGGLALLVPLATIAASLIPGEWARIQSGRTHRAEPGGGARAERPDIYYIILDGYGRADVLQALYGFDNSPFLDALRDRGFYVADRSLTNYNTTHLSLASSLNLGYVHEIVKAAGIELTPKVTEEMIWDSEARRYLEDRGYETAAFETGRPWSSIDNVDRYLAPGSQQALDPWMVRRTVLNEFETILVDSTMLSLLVDNTKLFSNAERSQSALANEEHRARIVYALGTIPDVALWEGDYFTFLHVLSPHPPFIFGPNGEAIDHDRPFTFGDASNFMQIGTRQDYLEGYIQQLEYINKLTLNAVDGILSQSSSPPVIIIQGDHGPGAYLDWQSMEDSNLTERAAVLNAYYLPGDEGKTLYPSISPVNSFRVVFNAVFGDTFALLEDRSFFTEKNGGYNLVDISDRVR